jgi:sugar lactone lactonase YvrE
MQRNENRTGWWWLLLVGLLGLTSAHAQDAVTSLNPAGEAGYANGPLTQARFNDPAGVAFDATGNLYVADSRNHVIRKITPAGSVSLLAGTPGEPGFANGAGTAAKFDTPFGISVSNDGNVIVSDAGNHVLRQINTSGVVSTLAGQPGTYGATNGPVSAALFHTPLGITHDHGGNLLIADSGNHAIRRLTTNNIVETIAGVAEVWGYADGVAAQAKFNGPVDVAVATDGRIFVSDGFNHVIRCVQTNGTVTTVAGQAGTAAWADGQVSEARFWNPAGLALDVSGDLYVADSLNHAIRKVTAQGNVITVSGRGRSSGTTDGSNGAGRYFNPYGLAFDLQGHLVVSDSYNQALRQVLVPFTVTTARENSGSTRVIRWLGVIGKRYQVQFTDDLQNGNWQNLSSSLLADQFDLSVTDATSTGTRFYRVLILSNP